MPGVEAVIRGKAKPVVIRTAAVMYSHVKLQTMAQIVISHEFLSSGGYKPPEARPIPELVREQLRQQGK